jgi:uncharacterized membrane protein
MHIGNPVTWVFSQFSATEAIGSTPAATYFTTTDSGVPAMRRIGVDDIRTALRRGWSDTGAGRADLTVLWLIYPIMVAYIWAAVYYGQLVLLLLPVASGFALVGPLFAVGMYEMSRKRELSGEMHWLDGVSVLRSPSIWGIIGLGLSLMAAFAAWLVVATLIAQACLGPNIPTGLGFFTAAFTTWPGLLMLALGTAAGAVFAVLVLVISSVSFPLLLDRPATLGTAIRTSVQAVRLNPGPMALWGVIVALGLLLGSIPLFTGLIVVLPVLGHGTWHLYRAIVPRALNYKPLIVEHHDTGIRESRNPLI